MRIAYHPEAKADQGNAVNVRLCTKKWTKNEMKPEKYTPKPTTIPLSQLKIRFHRLNNVERKKTYITTNCIVVFEVLSS